jgi:hypothetical protein
MFLLNICMRFACRWHLIEDMLPNVLYAACMHVVIDREYATKCFICGLPAGGNL